MILPINKKKLKKAKEVLYAKIEIPIKFKPIKLTKRDLEFIEFREITEKQIMGRKNDIIDNKFQGPAD